MRRATHPLRLALAILAGTLFSPLFFGMATLLVAFLESPGGLGGRVGSDVGGALVFIWLTGLLFGGPLALASLLLVFGPMWLVLHRGGLGLGAFTGCAAVAAGLVGLVLMLLTAEQVGDEGAKVLAAFFLTGGLTGLLMWPIAYAGSPVLGVDPRALPQANFTAAEPSA